MQTQAMGEDNHGEPLVLLVEDNPDDALMVRRALRKSGLAARLLVLEHGDAAVEYLAGQHAYADRLAHPLPDVMLLDLKLPRRSGHEVLQWVRAQPAFDALPIVVLTSSSEDEDVRRAYRHRANSYLRKPVTFEHLTSLLALFHNYWLQANVTPLSQEGGA